MSDVRPPAASAIVLAGGRAARYGRNKLAEPLAGAPLVDRAVRAAAGAAREVLVLVPPDAEPMVSAAALGATGARIVSDPEAFGGPLVGLLAGLERVAEPLALVVGGDMPTLSVPVLGHMLRLLEGGEADAVVLRYRGRRAPLPICVRVGAGTPVARRLLAEGERSLRGFLAVLRVTEIAESDWRPLDPTAATLRDVDTPDDLRAAEDSLET